MRLPPIHDSDHSEGCHMVIEKGLHMVIAFQFPCDDGGSMQRHLLTLGTPYVELT